MTATNRGATRAINDHYRTPDAAIDCIAHLLPRTDLVIDVGCGTGAIARRLKRPGAALEGIPAIGIDIERRWPALWQCDPYWGDTFDRLWAMDFRKVLSLASVVTESPLAIMNPPFSIAQEVIAHALGLVGPAGHVWALLRLPFLASKRRLDWWKQNPANYYVLNRPSFCWVHTYQVRCAECHKSAKQQTRVPSGTKKVATFAEMTPRQLLDCGHGAEFIDPKKATTVTTDATDYMWAAWGPGLRGRLAHL